ncbi:MAG TPA: hypothetical protein VG405_12805 [Solirubrobacteraceae bacterium]|nr:hypothetical protein [Solirubrobacteraceae bacterium]
MNTWVHLTHDRVHWLGGDVSRIGLRFLFFISLAAATMLPAGSAMALTGEQRAESFARAEVAHYAAKIPSSLQAPGSTATGTTVDRSCFSAADDHVNPETNSSGNPTNPAWYERDYLNQYCATLRLRDQYTSPAFGYEDVLQGDSLWIDQLGNQISYGPGHIDGGLTTLVPGSQAADAFRAVSEWKQRTGGNVLPVSFKARDGAVLRGDVWLPPAGTPLRHGRYPGVVITDGSVQAYQNLYYWAAEGLAQYGYEVLTYDVQGEGDSDLLPASCPSLAHPSEQCAGVPYQQDYNFFQGAEDSLSYFLSTPRHPYRGTYDPGWRTLARNDVAIAGHSLGADAVSWAGQCDKRVKTIVAWDDLYPAKISQCSKNLTVPRSDRATHLHAPALAMTNDYEFNIEPQTKVPNPNGTGISNGGGIDGTAGYLSLVRHRVDSEIVSIRNGTHLTYSYIPYVLPANELGERVAFYYTLAWLDEYLRHGHDPLLPAKDTAYHRLTTLDTFDRSADHNDNRRNRAASSVSFGAGTYSAAQAANNPTDPAAGNVPYEIRGLPIRDTLSFYYYSEYRIHDPLLRRHPVKGCRDMLAGCPRHQPAIP